MRGRPAAVVVVREVEPGRARERTLQPGEAVSGAVARSYSRQRIVRGADVQPPAEVVVEAGAPSSADGMVLRVRDAEGRTIEQDCSGEQAARELVAADAR